VVQNIWIELHTTTVIAFATTTTFRDSQGENFGVVGKRDIVDFLEAGPDLSS